MPIQPKNDVGILVDTIGEKTTSAGIRLNNSVFVDTLAELNSGQSIKFAHHTIPSVDSTVDLGSGTFKFRNAHIDATVTPRVGPTTASDLLILTNNVTRSTYLSTGQRRDRFSATTHQSGGGIIRDSVGVSINSTTPATFYTYSFTGASGTKVLIRVNLLINDSTSNNQQYLELAIDARTSGGAATAGTVTELHDKGTALVTVTALAAANTIQLQIANDSGSNQYYGIADITAMAILNAS